MIRAITSFVQRLTEWRRFVALVVLLFLVRGVFVLSILPPYEGWDEYQHVAYMIYMIENDAVPRLSPTTVVPRSMDPALRLYPHSPMGVEQVRSHGGLSYDEFWTHSRKRSQVAGGPDIFLYQSQHPWLYYRLMLPLFHAVWDPTQPLTAVTILRLVNLLFGAAAVGLCAGTLGLLAPSGIHRYLLAVLIALQPLFLLNTTRVSNDALAVLFGTGVVCVMLLMYPRRPRSAACAAGVLLAAALLTKAVTLALAPFVAWVIVASIIRRRVPISTGMQAALWTLGIVAVLTGPYFYSNLSEYGMLTPMQEALLNRRNHKTFGDFVATAATLDWLSQFRGMILRRSVWVGGWSFLTLPSWIYKTQETLAFVAGLGALVAAWRRLKARRRDEARALFAVPGPILHLTVLCLCVFAGLAFHMLQTQLALESVATNSWYAALAFPWMVCLLYQGFRWLPGKWTAIVCGSALGGVFLIAEIWGVLGVMVPAYTGASWGPLARQRLSEIHPVFPNPTATIPALAVEFAIVLAAVIVCAGARMNQTSRTGNRVGGLDEIRR